MAEHVAEDPVPDRVQDPLGVKLTVPVGAVAPVADVSDTVEVQLVAWLIATVDGLHTTFVVVPCLTAATVTVTV